MLIHNLVLIFRCQVLNFISFSSIYIKGPKTIFFLLIKKRRTERKMKVRVLTLYQGASTFSHRRTQEATELKPSGQILILLKVAQRGKFVLQKRVSISTLYSHFQKLAYNLRMLWTIVEMMVFLTSFGVRLAHANTSAVFSYLIFPNFKFCLRKFRNWKFFEIPHIVYSKKDPKTCTYSCSMSIVLIFIVFLEFSE